MYPITSVKRLNNIFCKYTTSLENDCTCDFICSGYQFMIILRMVPSTRKGSEPLMLLIAYAREVYAIHVGYVRWLKIYLNVMNDEVLSDFFLFPYSQILDSRLVSK